MESKYGGFHAISIITNVCITEKYRLNPILYSIVDEMLIVVAGFFFPQCELTLHKIFAVFLRDRSTEQRNYTHLDLSQPFLIIFFLK